MIGDREKTLVRTLFALFPNATKDSPELNKLWAEMFHRHPTDRCEAIIRAHRMERRGNDPCPATVRSRLAEAERVANLNRRTDRADEENPTIRALRSWAMSAFGHDAGQRMTAREIVEARCIAEWGQVPASIKPAPGSEHNFGAWLAMGEAAGMTETEARRMAANVTGCRHITKYDNLDNREMYRRYRQALESITTKGE